MYARFLRSSGNFGRGRGLGETHLDGETDLDTTPALRWFVGGGVNIVNI